MPDVHLLVIGYLVTRNDREAVRQTNVGMATLRGLLPRRVRTGTRDWTARIHGPFRNGRILNAEMAPRSRIHRFEQIGLGPLTNIEMKFDAAGGSRGSRHDHIGEAVAVEVAERRRHGPLPRHALVQRDG